MNVAAIRYLCVILGCVLGALGGADLSIAHLRIFADNMTVGRGFIGVAIVYFGKWRPFMTFVGALVFGSAHALQLWIQASGAPSTAGMGGRWEAASLVWPAHARGRQP